MPTKNVVLTDYQSAMVESLVVSGRYQNASEVLREGLRLVEREEARERAKLEALREAAARGWEDVAAGRYADVSDAELDDFISGLSGRHAALTDQRQT